MAEPAGLILYDHPSSTNALKVRFLLAELGHPYERVDVPLDGPRPAGYRDVHPFELIPALVDGELRISESNTVLRYLAERAGRADLRGEDPVRRARIDTVLDSLSLEVRPALWGVEELVIYGLAVSEHERTQRVEALATALESFDALLDPGGPFAAGGFSIADCALAGRLKHLPRLGLDTARFPRTERARAAAGARPAWRAALA